METKTYRAIRHDIVRAKQKQNDNEVHHPDEKINQIKNVFAEFEWDNDKNPKILEMFAGQGNLTNIYEAYGDVTAYDIKYLKTGDSFLEYHRLIADKKKFDIIDLVHTDFQTDFFLMYFY